MQSIHSAGERLLLTAGRETAAEEEHVEAHGRAPHCRKPLHTSWKEQAGIRGEGQRRAPTRGGFPGSVFGLCTSPGYHDHSKASETQSAQERNERVRVHGAGASRADGACKKFPFASPTPQYKWAAHRVPSSHDIDSQLAYIPNTAR